jgi:hypothetical protein
MADQKMTNLSAGARARMAKIIPTLASDRNGEVLAAADALRRVLKAEGLDLHDLAASLLNHDRPPATVQKETGGRGGYADEVRKRWDAEEEARRQRFRDVRDILYENVHEGIDLNELEQHWPKLREAERSLVRKFKWRYYRRLWCEPDVIRQLQSLSASVSQRRRTYKLSTKPSKRVR